MPILSTDSYFCISLESQRLDLLWVLHDFYRTGEETVSLVRKYVKAQFVNAGMCADFAIHDTSGDNPHAHVMLTMRPVL